MRDSSLLVEMIIVLVMYLATVLASIIICKEYKRDVKYHEVKTIVYIIIIASSCATIIFESLWLCIYLGLTVV